MQTRSTDMSLSMCDVILLAFDTDFKLMVSRNSCYVKGHKLKIQSNLSSK